MLTERRRNIFVVGTSGTGKTTFSNELAKMFDLEAVSASRWTTKFGYKKTDPDYRTKVTEATKTALVDDPYVCINDLSLTIESRDSHSFIIEGIRNPFDFMNLFSPERDYVIFLKPNDVKSVANNTLDDGVKHILSNVYWMIDANIVSIEQVFTESSHLILDTSRLTKNYTYSYKTQELFRRCN